MASQRSNGTGSAIVDAIPSTEAVATSALLNQFLDEDSYVGESWTVEYDYVTIQVHDHDRQKVGGLPYACFLVATRQWPPMAVESASDEDAAVILLRVIDSADLWNKMEVDKIRAEAGKRAFGDDKPWDSREHMDMVTATDIAIAGVKCRVLGTFYVRRSTVEKKLVLAFGADLANYYPNRGLKIYKPRGQALEAIVNFRDPDKASDDLYGQHKVPFGHVRYASTQRPQAGVDDVIVSFAPSDLLGQKTALFGMTRTGKSNTTKIIAKSVYELRQVNGPRIGQLIFDPNAEYANENVQDKGALRNVYKISGDASEVVVYGQVRPKNDPGRRLTKVNFYDTGDMLSVGKQLIDGVFAEQTSQYIRAFVATSFERPTVGDNSAEARFKRQILVYHTLLHRAGLSEPKGYRRSTKGLFGAKIKAALYLAIDVLSVDDPATLSAKARATYDSKRQLIDSKDRFDLALAERYRKAADVLDKEEPSWGELEAAFEALRDFIKTRTYRNWNATVYAPASSSGSDWHDSVLEALLGMYQYSAIRLVAEVKEWHAPDATRDYVDDIYDDLRAGRLVIVDQSLGDPDLNRDMADRIASRIFHANMRRFGQGEEPPQILVYIEEAHNLLPAGADKDTRGVWSRMAKEGAKFKIGMVYATQEPSSIQHNILKNTSNWFVAHLNHTDETRELKKVYDFEDFEPSIRRAQDRGFLRVKAMSNSFVVPVQILKFEID
jgi:hypothetical protein